MRRADLFDFRRVFLLLILTVCAPSLALSTFGILAIRHERAAVEENLAASYAAKLDRLAEAMAARIVARGTAYDPAADPGLAEEVAVLARTMFPEEQARFDLVRPTPPTSPEEAVRQLLESLATQPSDEDERPGSNGYGPPLVERKLGGALAGHALVVRLPVDDSPASIALANRVIYIVLLALFYAAIAVGIVLTSRAVYKEAKLSRLKTDFVSNVSHELRTPITAVRMLVETLRLGRVSSDDERAEVLGHLDQETARLATLVDRLLDWARIETGRKVYRKVAAPSADVIRSALAVFERQQLAKPGQVSLELTDPLPEVEVDRDAMSVVLLNLLVNAHKYTGPVKQIAVRAYPVGKKVAFEVEDNGPGVPKSERKRIFEQFYRVDDLLTRRTEGTGLGLAIAKRIVEDHGGKIEIAGEPGAGARFTVVLPASTREAT